MSCLKKFCLVSFIILFNFSNVFAEDKISYIDIEYIFNSSIFGKSISKELNSINNENISYLKLKENDLKNDDNEINRVKNIISKEELQKKINALKKKVKIYNEEKSQRLKDLNLKKKEKLKIFLDKISPIVEEYMTQNSISILMDKKNIFIAKPNYDITDKILKLVDSKIK